MAQHVDLYRTSITSMTPEELWTAVVALTRIESEKATRPPENYLLDYKREFDTSALTDVAAFANTFGGLLLIGVQEEEHLPVAIVGYDPKGDPKTRIVNLIVTNITPAPYFEIATCQLPSDPTRHVAALRITPSDTLHLLLKTDKPAYVRIEDTARPADALRLRALIDRERTAREQSSPATARLGQMESILYVTHRNDQANRVRTNAFLRLIALPRQQVTIRLTDTIERAFVEHVENAFRLTPIMANCRFSTARDLTFFDCTIVHEEHDHELRWRITSSGEIGFVAELRWHSRTTNTDGWSLYDVVAHTVHFLRLTKEFWQTAQYYGDGIVAEHLETGDATLHIKEGFPALFYEDHTAFPLNRQILALHPEGRRIGSVKQMVDYAGLDTNAAGIASALLTALLRSLGHLANEQRVQEEWTSVF